jgi:hypothetical protein
MAHIYIHWKRDTKSHKIILKHKNKNSIPYTDHHPEHKQTDRYSKSRIYEMKCLDCLLKYKGQTGRTLNTRYKEHIHAIRNKNSNTGYANHLLNTGHKNGIMTDTMEIIKAGKKGKTPQHIRKTPHIKKSVKTTYN